MLVKAQTKLSQDSINYYESYLRSNFDDLIIYKTDTANLDLIEIPNEVTVTKFNKIIDRLIDTKPNRIDYYTTKTFMYFKVKQYNNFLEASEKLLNQSINNNGEWYNLYDTSLVHPNTLVDTYLYYLNIFPPAKNNKGEYYINLIADQFNNYFPESVNAYRISAWSKIKLNKKEEALPLLLKASKKEPKNADVLVHLLDIYVNFNKKEEAKNIYTKILATNDTQVIDHANEVMKFLK